MKLSDTVHVLCDLCHVPNFADVVVEFDPVEYGPVMEGPLRSVSFRIVARAPPARPITVLFSTRSQTALGMAVQNNHDTKIPTFIIS